MKAPIGTPWLHRGRHWTTRFCQRSLLRGGRHCWPIWHGACQRGRPGSAPASSELQRNVAK
eukprot:697916-Prorocentrum_lima.AAC.1